MAEIYRDIGPLKELKNQLIKNNINDFHSVKELNSFISEYPNEINKIELEQKRNLDDEIIEKNNKLSEETENYTKKLAERNEYLNLEKINLENEYNQLRNKSFRLFSFFRDVYRKKIIEKKLLILKNNFQAELEKPYIDLKNSLSQLKKGIDYLNSNYEEVLKARTKELSSILDKKKKVIEDLYPVIAGAVGEQKALTELKKLGNEYSIINDVIFKFKRPIYNQQNNDYIYSIQIDHIVISKAGIFVIETKNWSKKSIENLDLYSPVNQLKRSSYAMFVVIHHAIENKHLRLNTHHWGAKKIPIKNILLMVGEKPKGEFQFVKLLSLNEILRHINYFQPILDDNDVKKITNFILKKING